jgi:hypothetical protein
MLSSTTCGFRSTISSIWFDVSCIEIPPRLSALIRDFGTTMKNTEILQVFFSSGQQDFQV